MVFLRVSFGLNDLEPFICDVQTARLRSQELWIRWLKAALQFQNRIERKDWGPSWRRNHWQKTKYSFHWQEENNWNIKRRKQVRKKLSLFGGITNGRFGWRIETNSPVHATAWEPARSPLEWLEQIDLRQPSEQ